MKHNLLSVGQLEDKDYYLQFKDESCTILDQSKNLNTSGTKTRGNVFHLNPSGVSCFVAKIDDSWLWHKRFCHVNFDNIVKASNTFA